MSDEPLYERADEAAHEAVLALLKSGQFAKTGTNQTLEKRMTLLTAFHRHLADYYRSLAPKED